MKFVSLFAGIGGFDLALEREGHECVYANDIDKYCKQVYDRHFKNQLDTTDIRRVRSEDIPDHDLLVGGFPCQAFSVAGKRAGFDDTRGTLFFEIARLLRDKRPRYFLLENVKGLLNHDGGKTIQTMFGVLTDLGYEFQWQVLNSKNHGVPQNRERILIAGLLRTEPRREVFPLGEIPEVPNGEAEPNQRQPQTTALTLRAATRSNMRANDTYIAGKIDNGEFKEHKDEALTVDANYWKGPDNHVQRTVVANHPIKLGNIYPTKHDSVAGRVYHQDGIGVTLSALGGGVGAKTGLYAIQDIRGMRKKQNGKGYKEEAKESYTLDTLATQGITEGMRIRRLTPTECERLQGFPDGWTDNLSDTQRYKTLGNAVTVNVIEYVAKRLIPR